MLNVRRILFPTDFSACAAQALDHALALAHRHGSTLHMFHAVVLHADDPNDPAHRFPGADEIRDRLEQLAEQRMSDHLAERRTDGLQIERAQRRGISAAPAILAYAEEVEADVIVMGTHGRRGLGHALLGSVAEEVVRLAPCPVLTVRGREEGPGPPEPRAILVPVDFSEPSSEAVRYAKEMAGGYGATLRLLHVFERPVHPEIYIGGTPIDIPSFATLEGSLDEAVRTTVHEAGGPDVEFAVEIREGRAVPGILDAAAEGPADLIVIATHGLTGMAHVLLGSVTEKVVRRAECPVFTVKTFGKSLLG